MRSLGDHGFTPLPSSPFSESGMKLASMAIRPADDTVYATFEELLVNGLRPHAILLSAGGNDCVKNALLQYVRDASTGLRIDQPAWQNHLRTLRGHCATLIGNFRAVSQRFALQVPIVLHGYDHPVADGRFLFGMTGNAWLHGWLVKTLHHDVAAATAIMRDLIDGLNDMQQSLAAADVLPVNLAGTLRATIGAGMNDAEWSAGGYKKAWENELHPTPDGFAALAARLASEIKTKL
jgi:lysophospholipase L1-like esterase